MTGSTDPLELYREALRLRLELGHRTLSAQEIVCAYNGTGPEWMPSWIRRSLDSISGFMLPAVLVHDLDDEYGERTFRAFRASNSRFERNALSCADQIYADRPARRRSARCQARLYAGLCRLFGWAGYGASPSENNAN